MRELLETYDAKLQYCPEKKQNVIFTKTNIYPEKYVCQYENTCRDKKDTCNFTYDKMPNL